MPLGSSRLKGQFFYHLRLILMFLMLSRERAGSRSGKNQRSETSWSNIRNIYPRPNSTAPAARDAALNHHSSYNVISIQNEDDSATFSPGTEAAYRSCLIFCLNEWQCNDRPPDEHRRRERRTRRVCHCFVKQALSRSSL